MEFVDRSRKLAVFVGDFVARYTLALRDLGWPSPDQLGVVGEANGLLAVVKPTKPSVTASDVDAQLGLIDRAVGVAIALAAAENVPATFRRKANRLLREALPVPAARVATEVRRLPAPASGDGAAA